MHANVNLDALLEKMKAELERAKSDIDLKKVVECLEAIRPIAEERERDKQECSPEKYLE